MTRPSRPARVVVYAIALGLAVSVVTARPAVAHQGHRRAGSGDTLAAAPDSAAAVRIATGEDTTAGVAPYVMPPFREATLEHLHNKIVHFPIALAFAAAMLALVARRRAAIEPAARGMIWLAALGGLAAYLSGRAQEPSFHGEPKEWLARSHGTWGVATGIALAVWAALTLWRPARPRAWLLGLIVMALIAVTAHLGGLLAHGE